MLIVFFALIGVLLVLFVLSNGKYDDYVKLIDKKEYPLKQLLPMGLYILELSAYRYATGYDRHLLMRITEIHGPKHSQIFLRIHWANKMMFLVLGLLFISFVGANTGIDAGLIFFGVSLLGGLIYFTDYEVNERIKKRRSSIQIDFPDFLNKLTLLINAGMTVSKAWEKVVLDNRKGRPLYEELYLALLEIRSGKSEVRAYEDFAKRCRLPEATRVISVILQNIRKGNSELVSILRVHTNDCWEMRKNAAKRLGEEASTKMLLPMLLMFLAILLIVATPAVLALRGI